MQFTIERQDPDKLRREIWVFDPRAQTFGDANPQALVLVAWRIETRPSTRHRNWDRVEARRWGTSHKGGRDKAFTGWLNARHAYQGTSVPWADPVDPPPLPDDVAAEALARLVPVVRVASIEHGNRG